VERLQINPERRTSGLMFVDFIAATMQFITDDRSSFVFLQTAEKNEMINDVQSFQTEN
jgi:hypothetical protein